MRDAKTHDQLRTTGCRRRKEVISLLFIALTKPMVK